MIECVQRGTLIEGNRPGSVRRWRVGPTLGRCSRVTYLGDTLREQIDVGAINELGRLDTQAPHEVFRFANTAVEQLIVAEHDLKLEEVTQVLDNIQVNPGSAGQVQRAMFPHAADNTVRQRESFTQRVGVGRWSPYIKGLLRPLLIGTAIEDQLAGVVGEDTQFQTTRRTVEERIVLQNFRRAAVGERRRTRGEHGDARDTSFDLDVACHSMLGSVRP